MSGARRSAVQQIEKYNHAFAQPYALASIPIGTSLDTYRLIVHARKESINKWMNYWLPLYNALGRNTPVSNRKSLDNWRTLLYEAVINGWYLPMDFLMKDKRVQDDILFYAGRVLRNPIGAEIVFSPAKQVSSSTTLINQRSTRNRNRQTEINVLHSSQGRVTTRIITPNYVPFNLRPVVIDNQVIQPEDEHKEIDDIPYGGIEDDDFADMIREQEELVVVRPAPIGEWRRIQTGALMQQGGQQSFILDNQYYNSDRILTLDQFIDYFMPSLIHLMQYMKMVLKIYRMKLTLDFSLMHGDRVYFNNPDGPVLPQNDVDNSSIGSFSTYFFIIDIVNNDAEIRQMLIQAIYNALQMQLFDASNLVIHDFRSIKAIFIYTPFSNLRSNIEGVSFDLFNPNNENDLVRFRPRVAEDLSQSFIEANNDDEYKESIEQMISEVNENRWSQHGRLIGVNYEPDRSAYFAFRDLSNKQQRNAQTVRVINYWLNYLQARVDSILPQNRRNQYINQQERAQRLVWLNNVSQLLLREGAVTQDTSIKNFTMALAGFFNTYPEVIFNHNETQQQILNKFQDYLDADLPGTFIPTPPDLAKTRSVINPKNSDQYCLIYALNIALHFTEVGENRNRYQKYLQWNNELINSFTVANIPIPFAINKELIWRKVEKIIGRPINIYGYDSVCKDKPEEKLKRKMIGSGKPIQNESTIYLHRATKDIVNWEKLVNLCMITDKTESKQHMIAITNLDGFLRQGRTNKVQICPLCMAYIPNRIQIKYHILNDCQRVNCGVRITLPPEDKAIIKPPMSSKTRKIMPFMIVADFECLIKSIEEPEYIGNDNLYKAKPKTIIKQQHVPCGYAYTVIDRNHINRSEPIKHYRGPDAGVKLMDELLKVQNRLMNRIKFGRASPLESDKSKLDTTEIICYLCGNDNIDDATTIPHWCKVSGHFLGYAHDRCITDNYEKLMVIPVVFHNLTGYDSHILLQSMIPRFQMKKKSKTERVDNPEPEQSENHLKISAICLNQEKVKTFTYDRLRFIDSFSFLSGSLEEQVKNLVADKSYPWHFIKKEYINCSVNPTLLPLVTGKGVYPYEYMDSFERFKETKLPPRESFKSSLYTKLISEDDYKHAQRVWETFRIKDLGAYHDFYMRQDVALLAEVWNCFCETAFEADQLDPAQFVTISSYTWANMMNYVKPTINLFNDQQVDMHLFIERGLRGGVSSVCGKRYGRMELPKDFTDHDTGKTFKKGTYIFYIDANNLYGLAMSDYLPIGGYHWAHYDFIRNKNNEIFMDPVKFTKFIINHPDDSMIGYAPEVDLHYPEDLHDLHNDFPLAVEKLKPRMKNGKQSPQSKLILSLQDKKNYVCHYRNLKFYLEQGLVITKVHRVLGFTQERWMEPYITKNTLARSKDGISEIAKNLYKQLVNSIYGKCLENKRKRRDIRLVTDPLKFMKLLQHPRYKNSIEFNDHLVGMEFAKKEVMLDKPIAVGFTVLELSKLHMQKFWYEKLKSKYGEDITLMYTDTDSFVFELKCEDYEKEILSLKDDFDLSNFPENHKLYDKENKMKLGKFKIETAHPKKGFHMINEFCVLRSKMYSYVLDNNTEGKRAKGVGRDAVSFQLKHDHYKKTLDAQIQEICHALGEDFIINKEVEDDESNAANEVTFHRIRSKNHQLSTVQQTKVSLSAIDDKRIIMKDKSIIDKIKTYCTYAYGHKDLKEHDAVEHHADDLFELYDSYDVMNDEEIAAYDLQQEEENNEYNKLFSEIEADENEMMMSSQEDFDDEGEDEERHIRSFFFDDEAGCDG